MATGLTKVSTTSIPATINPQNPQARTNTASSVFNNAISGLKIGAVGAALAEVPCVMGSFMLSELQNGQSELSQKVDNFLTQCPESLFFIIPTAYIAARAYGHAVCATTLLSPVNRKVLLNASLVTVGCFVAAGPLAAAAGGVGTGMLLKTFLGSKD